MWKRSIGAGLRRLGSGLGIALVMAALGLLGADLIASLEAGGRIVARVPTDWMVLWGIVLPAGGASAFLQAMPDIPAWVYPGLGGVVLVFFFGPRQG